VAGKIAVLGATPSVEYIAPVTSPAVKAVMPAPVLFNPTFPDMVDIPVIAVCARTEKLAAAPSPGSVAAIAELMPDKPSINMAINAIATTPTL
jgi:hypothetical protein